MECQTCKELQRELTKCERLLQDKVAEYEARIEALTRELDRVKNLKPGEQKSRV